MIILFKRWHQNNERAQIGASETKLEMNGGTFELKLATGTTSICTLRYAIYTRTVLTLKRRATNPGKSLCKLAHK